MSIVALLVAALLVAVNYLSSFEVLAGIALDSRIKVRGSLLLESEAQHEALETVVADRRVAWLWALPWLFLKEPVFFMLEVAAHADEDYVQKCTNAITLHAVGYYNGPNRRPRSKAFTVVQQRDSALQVIRSL